MFGPPKANPPLSGAIVSVYNAGQALGGLSTGFFADKLSRKWTIFLAAFISMATAPRGTLYTD